jgi:nucleoside-diphosphate-sugar epimerase
MKVLITGAAGNLGSHLAKFLLAKNDSGINLRLMIYKSQLPFSVGGRAEVCKADLSKKETLSSACKNIDCIVHFAGVLFAPDPEKFLPTTNVVYFRNLVDAAIEERVRKIILISFPHVEGHTTPENPASGRLDGNPVSVHAQTRLLEERYLFECADEEEYLAASSSVLDKNATRGQAPLHHRPAGNWFVPISLRVGMVYGKNILMLDAAKWLLRRRLLAVWKEPTWIHLISLEDFLEAVRAAILNPKAKGIYHIGDDKPLYLQEFLDMLAHHIRYPTPWRLPQWCFYLAAWTVEKYARLFGTKSPLTKDFIKIGMVNYVGDTKRMKDELLAELKYPTIEQGIENL